MEKTPCGFTEIPLNRTNQNSFIDPKILYFVRISGHWYSGYFSKQWYGWSFNNWGTSGVQLDFIEKVFEIIFMEE